jgi:DNA polymerase epsilon subunit 1
LAVNAVLQSHHINDAEGAGGTIASFDSVPQASFEDMMSNPGMSILTAHDETAQCMPAFRVLKVRGPSKWPCSVRPAW